MEDPYQDIPEATFTEENDFLENEILNYEQNLNPPTADFYGVLNVDKEATEEELKEAYKRLCRAFHPDKHLDPENKKLAETKFQVIQKAYEGVCITFPLRSL
ncbi:hypothetical protein G9A89_013780 [Geosiphon pyriformis]|nr:hypothetical protein G9A89_013780 [Geosiphon pyriformis]